MRFAANLVGAARQMNGRVKRSEELRILGALSAINGSNQQERSVESIRTGPYAYTLAS
jgi:hypothetical protein